MPYDPNLPIPEQVHASVASSMKNLATPDHPFIECLVLHDPYDDDEDTLTCWKTLETYVPHAIKALGISNAGLDIVRILNETCKVKPVIVQNRFHRTGKWDVSLRKYCREEGIIFQSIWTLTKNREQLKSKPVLALAEELEKLGVGDPPVVALYSLVIGLGNVTMMDGTTNAERMKTDVEGLKIVTKWAEEEGNKKWEELLGEFKAMIGEDS